MKPEEMEKRLRTLESIEEIRNLHYQYVFWLNNQQWDDMADCFAENATADIHGLHKGKTEIVRLFKEVIPKLNAGKGRDAHFTVQPVISVEENKAKGHWLIYILISDPTTGNALRWIQGKYDCEYVKLDGKWKFSLLKFTSHWPVQSESKPK